VRKERKTVGALALFVTNGCHKYLDPREEIGK